MNSFLKASISESQCSYFHLRAAAFFHSTPVLERKRRTSWGGHRPNNYNRRFGRVRGQQQLLRNLGVFTDYLFQNWKAEFGDDEENSSKRTSGFKKPYSRGARRGHTSTHAFQNSDRRNFDIYEDFIDVEVENFFHSSFGGRRSSFESFINEEDWQWRSSSSHSNRYQRSWNWRYREEDDDDDSSSSEYESSDSDMSSHRLALGLSASGPLKLEDIKTAYRSCALKWHPDRHEGSTKGVAEEKFKLCSAAYQSLCDKVVVS